MKNCACTRAGKQPPVSPCHQKKRITAEQLKRGKEDVRTCRTHSKHGVDHSWQQWNATASARAQRKSHLATAGGACGVHGRRNLAKHGCSRCPGPGRAS